MANILVEIVSNANSSANCLKIVDLDLEGLATAQEDGTALRKTVSATINETVTWWAGANAGPLAITFDKGFSPFQGAPVAGANAAATMQNLKSGSSAGAASGRYKYTISLNGVTEDPQIIIDNSQTAPMIAKPGAAPKGGKNN